MNLTEINFLSSTSEPNNNNNIDMFEDAELAKFLDNLMSDVDADADEPDNTNDPNNPNKSEKSSNLDNIKNDTNANKIDDLEDLDNFDDLDQDMILSSNGGKNKRIKFGLKGKYGKIITLECKNPLCDHKKHKSKEVWESENPIKIQNVDNLGDIILLADFYHCKMRTHYNGIDLKILFGIKKHLVLLNEMIGLAEVKEEIVNLIIHLLLAKNLSENSIKKTFEENQSNSDMFHSVVTGSPGCGKTTFIEILAKILTGVGILESGHIVKVKRSDLVGKYLGHTAVQTQKKIDEAYGGILLIDEAYSLGNPEQRDSFSKECLDTLNQALSENKSNFICIIAGYSDALDTSFFSYNEGLRRRFPFRFDISPYNYRELSLILDKKIREHINKYDCWTIQFSDKELAKLIEDNFGYFTSQGGDMETLFLNIKITHNKRIFLLDENEKKKLTLDDVKNSINKFIKFKGNIFNKDKIPEHLYGLYI